MSDDDPDSPSDSGRPSAGREPERSEASFRAIAESARDAVLTIDSDSSVVYANPAVREVFGYSPDELVGEPLGRIMPEEMWERHQAALEEYLESGERHLDWSGVELPARRADGSRFTVEISFGEYRIDGERYFTGIVRDVSDRVEAERARRASEERYRHLFQESRDLIYITDPGGTVVDVNPAGEELLGYPREEIVGRDVSEFYHHEPDRERFVRAIREQGYVEDFEVPLETRDGRIRDCLVTATVRTDEHGEVECYQGIIRDITERKAFEEELERRALHDPLTGLPNRALFWDRLGQAVAQIRRHGGSVAVLYLDLDRFKAVNESLGHLAGDQVLREAASRLGSAVREPDTVARVGGDEFTVLLEHLEGDRGNEDGAVEEVVERLIAAMEAPFQAAEQAVHLGVSVGVARLTARQGEFDPPTEDPEALIRRADAALFRAKEGRGTDWAVYDPERDRTDRTRIQRENELRRALEREQFELHYQPVVELEGGRIVGVEPLIRWRHPERGLLAPAEFLDTLEESGLILPVGRWILREACRQVTGWNRELRPDRPLRLRPNLSASQFDDPDLPGELAELLAEAGADPGSLVLEVTEHLVMRSPARTRELAELGVELAIDDFGTGYSSLGYVRDLTAHELKVDRTFVNGVGRDRREEAIVTTILTLGDTLDLRVVAEGVEELEQLRWLERAGCARAQGFLFARPVPAEQMEELLRREAAERKDGGGGRFAWRREGSG